MLSYRACNPSNWGVNPHLHKAAYFESLAKAREQENEDIFCEFMYGELHHFLTQSIYDFEKSQERDVPVNVPVNVPVKLSDRQREILRLMQNNPAVTLQQVAGQLNVNEKTVKRDVAVLRSQGVLHREGSDKTGLWRVSL